RDVGLGQDLRIDRDEVGLPAGLDAVTTEEEQDGGARPHLSVEAIEGALRRLLGEILADVDLEAVAPQLVGDGTRVRGRLLQRRFGVRIVAVSDDEGDLVAIRRGGRANRYENGEGKKNEEPSLFPVSRFPCRPPHPARPS